MKHSWMWVWPGPGRDRFGNWIRFWSHPTRQCVRCKARLRIANTGPRGGDQYAYRASGKKTYVSTTRIPECSFRRAGGGPPVSEGFPSSSPARSAGVAGPAVGPTERVEDIIARYEQHAAEWRAKGRVKEAEAMEEIVASLRAGTATDPRTVA